MSSLQAIRWDGESLHLLDQRRLPGEWTWLQLRSHVDVARAIAEMVVRGAPAIAITAAYGMALAVREAVDREEASARLLAARPTATITEIGVASPSAQGQAIRSTVIAVTKA